MGIPDGSREQIEACLAELEDRYDSVPVSQTTVSLPPDRYASVRERTRDCLDAYVQIYNDDGEILHVDGDGNLTDDADRDGDGIACEDGFGLPGVRVAPDGTLERRVREAVETSVGIECTVDGIDRATIVGVRNDEDDCETLYHMSVVFTGTHTGGEPDDSTEWQSSPEDVQTIRAR